jgi:hypothetical protein
VIRQGKAGRRHENRQVVRQGYEGGQAVIGRKSGRERQEVGRNRQVVRQGWAVGQAGIGK